MSQFYFIHSFEFRTELCYTKIICNLSVSFYALAITFFALKKVDFLSIEPLLIFCVCWKGNQLPFRFPAEYCKLGMIFLRVHPRVNLNYSVVLEGFEAPEESYTIQPGKWYQSFLSSSNTRFRIYVLAQMSACSLIGTG